MTKRIDISKDTLSKLISSGNHCKEILDILKISKSTLYKNLKKFGLTIPNTDYFNNTVFDVIDSEEKAYWLGFLYADGYISGKNNNSVELSLKAEDKYHLEKFRKFISCKKPINVSKSTEDHMRCRCVVTNKHFHDRLIELGCVPNKSTKLKFPDTSIFSKESLVFDFIRGYIDGDGSITSTSRGGKLRIEVIGTKEFLLGVMKIFGDKFNKILPTKSSKNGVNNFRIVCSHLKAEKVGELLYSGSTIYLDRKFQKFAKLYAKFVST